MDVLLALFTTISIQNGLPEGLLESLCWVESKHDVLAIHHDDGDADSLGICQIKLSTAKELGFKGTAKQLMNPKMNIKYSAKYLKWQIQRYGSTARGVIAYNRGNSRGLTTSRYQRKVFKKWKQEKSK